MDVTYLAPLPLPISNSITVTNSHFDPNYHFTINILNIYFNNKFTCKVLAHLIVCDSYVRWHIFNYISYSDVTTEIPEFPEDLLKIIKNNIRIEELSDEQINQLSELMISWIEIMQKELNIIKGMEVRDRVYLIIIKFKKM